MCAVERSAMVRPYAGCPGSGSKGAWLRWLLFRVANRFPLRLETLTGTLLGVDGQCQILGERGGQAANFGSTPCAHRVEGQRAAKPPFVMASRR